jgi:uncharacterized membrane protein YdjX (TVP38/TMEM64 family)
MNDPEPGSVGKHRIPRPSVDDFVFEGEEMPLLLRRPVVFGLVAVFIALVAGYVLAVRLFGLSLNFDAAPFKEWVDGFGVWGPVIFIVVMALSVLFAPIPNVPIFVAAGLAWGPVVGTLYSMAGLVLGSTMAFHAARWLGRRHLSRLVGAKLAGRLDHLADTMGGRVIFWSRMLPAVNFDWISFVAGMTSIRFVTFIVYSALGMLVPTALVVAAGDGLARDPRITLTLVGCWMAAIIGSALFFWQRRRRWQARRASAVAEVRTEFGNSV